MPSQGSILPGRESAGALHFLTEVRPESRSFQEEMLARDRMRNSSEGCTEMSSSCSTPPLPCPERRHPFRLLVRLLRPVASWLPKCLRWTTVFMVGIGTGLTAVGVTLITGNNVTAATHHLSGSGSLFPEKQLLIGCTSSERLNYVIVVTTAVLCTAVALTAGSAGLPDLKSFLAGPSSAPVTSTRKLIASALWRVCQLLFVRQVAANAAAMVSGHDSKLGNGSAYSDEGEPCGSPAATEEHVSASERVASAHQSEAPCVVTEEDLTHLVRQLEKPWFDEEHRGQWEAIVVKEDPGVSYSASRRDPLDGGPTEYMSCTVYQDCSAELLREFYMDSHNLVEWDVMVKSYRQLQICSRTGLEVGHFVKKYPFCSPREYVLTWRIWQGPGDVTYCITKAVDSPLAPRNAKLRRVDTYLSGWRIRPVAGSTATEIQMVIKEDVGMQRDMAKMAFRRGIWGYIRSSEAQLRKYAAKRRDTRWQGPDALRLAQDVPSHLWPPSAAGRDFSGVSREAVGSVKVHQVACSMSGFSGAGSSSATKCQGVSNDRGGKRQSEGRDMKKNLAGAALFLGGALMLTNGAAPLGARFAVAFLLKKIFVSGSRSEAGSGSSSMPDADARARQLPPHPERNGPGCRGACRDRRRQVERSQKQRWLSQGHRRALASEPRVSEIMKPMV